MNQLIQQMAVRERTEDLLKDAIELHTPKVPIAASSCISHLNNTEQKLTKEPKSTENTTTNSGVNTNTVDIPSAYTPHIKDDEKQLQMSAADAKGKLDFSQNTNSGSCNNRLSIPTWIMNSSELDAISKVHTGLTPERNKQESSLQNKQKGKSNFKKVMNQKSKGRYKANLITKENTNYSINDNYEDYEDGSESDDNHNSSTSSRSSRGRTYGYTNRFALDVLFQAETKKTLQHQRLVEKYKKRLIMTSSTAVGGLSIKSAIGAQRVLQLKNRTKHHHKTAVEQKKLKENGTRTRYDELKLQEEFKKALKNQEQKKMRQE